MKAPTFLTQVQTFAWKISAEYKTAVYADVHDPSLDPKKSGRAGRNLHAHLVFSTREVTPEGFGKKTRILDEKLSAADEIVRLREEWAKKLEKGMETQGMDIQFDGRSYEKRGINKIPQIKEGAGRAIQERGLFSHQVARNEEIARENARLAALAEQIRKDEEEVKRLEAEIAQGIAALSKPLPAQCLRKKAYSKTFVGGKIVPKADLLLHPVLKWVESEVDLAPYAEEIRSQIEVLETASSVAAGSKPLVVPNVGRDLEVIDLLEILSLETSSLGFKGPGADIPIPSGPIQIPEIRER
jgi:hypothetical protein